MSIDDFYKAIGYSFIYKCYNRKVDELPIRDMTLTLVRHTYPRGLMKALMEEGFTVEETHPGIFRVEGKINIKAQIIVSSRLLADEYEGLQLIASGCTKDAVVRYAGKAAASDDGNVKTNAETVMTICLSINKGLDSEMEDDMSMNIRETIDGIFAVIEKEGRKKGIKEGRLEGAKAGRLEGVKEGRLEGVHETNERVAKDMLKKNLPLSLIAEISRLSEDSIRTLAKSLGVAVV